jgi:hypothetical protein
MSKKDKLYERIKGSRDNVTFNDLIHLMRNFGFEDKKVKHGCIFKHEGLKGEILPHVPKPHGRENKVLKPYVDICLEAIELLLLKEEGNISNE